MSAPPTEAGVWNADRLATVGDVLDRLSTKLERGYHLRLGMEGDECYPFRSTEEAPKLEVLDVTREPNGYVRFRARDAAGTEYDLDNRNVAPDRIWEADPDHMPGSYRGDDDAASATSPPPGTPADDEAEDPFATHRSAVAADIAEVRARIESLETATRAYRATSRVDESADREFRSTMGEAVYALANDLMRVSRGETPEFAMKYAARWTDAVDPDVGGARDRGGYGDDDADLLDAFRGKHSEHKPRDKYQGEKTDYEIEPLSYESLKTDNLTDDEAGA